ncbi:MAG: hypothetical protein ACK4ZM_05060, partial [bacterium]
MYTNIKKQIKIIITIIIFILLITFFIQTQSYSISVTISDLEDTQKTEVYQSQDKNPSSKSQNDKQGTISKIKNRVSKIREAIKQERNSEKNTENLNSSYQSTITDQTLLEQYQKNHIKNYLDLKIFVHDINGNKILSNVKIETPSFVSEEQTKSEFNFSPLKPGNIKIYIQPLQENLQKIAINSNIEKDTKLFVKIPPSEFTIKLSLFDFFTSLSPQKLNYQLFLNDTLLKNHELKENSILIPLTLKKENSITTELLTQEEIDNSLKIETM